MKMKIKIYLKKKKKLEIISEGKGIITCEIIVDMKSFFIKINHEFWEKSEFLSELKESDVNDEDYEIFISNSKNEKFRRFK